ncbi:hypothetical protein ACIHIX_39620 [Streptomyces sp. NPDC051913]|uniref:hypothetical protein n=1 Tax=Streptomyces sp. NPDC051913 TaxID=3365676 RepID=UPI0037D60F2B
MAAMGAAGDEAAVAEGMWRATDLTRAYLDQDRVRVGACLDGLDSVQVEHLLVWQVLEHDMLFDDLGEPSMSVRVLDEVSALAPVDCEFVMTTAVREAVAAGTGLSSRLQEFAVAAQVHALTVCMVVMLLEAHGRHGALEFVAASAEDFVRRGFPRPYPAT